MGYKSVYGAIIFTQSTAATVWNINHNMDTLAPCVDFWVTFNNQLTKIIPASVVVVDANNVQATFTSAQSGIASVV